MLPAHSESDSFLATAEAGPRAHYSGLRRALLLAGASGLAAAAAGASRGGIGGVSAPALGGVVALDDTAEAWRTRGLHGGAKINGMWYSKKDCFRAAIHADPHSCAAWVYFGREGGGNVGGLQYDEKTCYRKAISEDETCAAAWVYFGQKGGGIVGGLQYDEKTCYRKAIAEDKNSALAWLNFCRKGGGEVAHLLYSGATCFMKTLAHDPNNADAWYELGKLGCRTNVVGDTAKSCFEKVVGYDPKHADAWEQLGLLGGGGGKDAIGCFRRALEIDPARGSSWLALGRGGGGEVGTVSFSPSECFLQALKVFRKADPANPKDIGTAWAELCVARGGNVDGVLYTGRACYQEAMKASKEVAQAWYGLGLENIFDVDPVKCKSRLTCFAQAASCVPKHAESLAELGWELGDPNADERTKYFSEALALKPTLGRAWEGAGHFQSKPFSIFGSSYTKEECFIQAAIRDPKYWGGWYRLSKLAKDVQVLYTTYTQLDCAKKAVEADQTQKDAWCAVYAAMGSGGVEIAGKAYSKNDVKIKGECTN